MDEKDRERIRAEFDEAVNMTPKELEAWLDTDESKSAGRKKDDESVGHASGRRIVDLLHRKKSELDDDDYRHMRYVVGFVHRHTAQRPAHNVEKMKWRYSLMNWGHDPLKD
ncbi:MAG TPA: DUF3140 domain-containing protein [Micromonosporaceae bacterium]|nr:DUF3140 domain-containing protein [Micromonosporaceae bacterium]